MEKFSLTPKKMNVIFMAILVVLFLFLGFYNELFLGPKGIHFFRQVDSLSFVYGYFNNGMNFFEPQVFNLNAIEGKSAAEFPILYYVAALLFKGFGAKMYVLKWIHLAITYIGVLYLFRFVQDLLQDYYYTFLVVLLLFSSTVFNYYSFNYLPDTAALGFTFIGLFFMNRYRLQGKKNQLLFATLYFGLACLIKITFLIYPLTILVVASYSILFSENKVENGKVKRIVFSQIIVVLLVMLWTIYTVYYNIWNQASFFLNSPIPIWQMSGADIEKTWILMSRFWYSTYFAYSTFHILWGLLFIQLLFIRKTSKLLNALTWISFFGFIAYVALFLRQFQDHDYYIFVGFPLFVLFLTQGVFALKTILKTIWLHRLIQAALTVVVVAGINYSRMKLKERFHENSDNYNRSARIISKYSKEINALTLPADAKIIVGPDESTNAAFLYLNRKGWTIAYNKHIDSGAISAYKKRGAGYFILTNNDPEKEQLLLNFGDRILLKNDLEIFRL